jgi:hypothetical protein
MTRRLLLVAAVVAILGLAATPALEETAVGDWFGLPWDGGRGLGQPGQQAEPTAPPPTVDRQAGSVGQRGSHAKPRAHGHGPKVRPPRAIPTRGRPPGDRRATRMRRRGRVAGSRNRIRALGEGEINQLLAVTEVLGHMTVAGNGLGDRPDGPAGCWSDRTRGMAAMRGHRRSAAVLESASLPGPLVAVGPLHLGLSCLGWRPRGGSLRTGSGLAPPRPTGWQQGCQPAGLPRGRHPRAFPAKSAPTEHPLGVAADVWSGYAQLRSPCRWRVASGRAPSDPASLGPS